MINTSVEWHSPEERARQRHKKVSTIHGWVVKMRGTFFGSERTRRAGMREMKEARAIRRYKKEHPEHFRLRGGSGGGKVLWIFPRRNRRSPEPRAEHGHHHSSRSHSHGHRTEYSNSHSHGNGHEHGHAHSHSHSHSHSRHGHGHGHSHSQSDRHRHQRHHGAGAYYGEGHDGPCLHFHHRVHPHHHGFGTFLRGLLTGKRDLKEKGRYLKQRAAKERRKEKRYRRHQRRNEALVIKMDGTLNKNRWWRR